jgi:putative ATP-dependent endonuclease of OLD family
MEFLPLKLISIEIYNFRSIKNLHILDVSHGLCFIGKNSAGKSNILKALKLPASKKILLQEKFSKLVRDVYFGQHHHSTSFYELSDEIEITMELSFDEKSLKVFQTFFNHKNFEITKNMLLSASFDPYEDTIPSRDIFIKTEHGFFESITEKLSNEEIESIHRKIIKDYFIYPPDYATQQIKVTSTKTMDDKLAIALIDLENEYKGAMNNIKRDFRRVTGINADILQINGSDIIFVREDIREPLSFLSNGTRRILSILTAIEQTRQVNGILLLEDPELYLDPKVQRSLSFLLTEFIQKENCQLLLTTQSPKFMLGSTYICQFSNQGTLVHQVNEDDLEEIVNLFGIRPSDSLGADFVIFVEGATDARVYQIFETKLRKYHREFPKIAYVAVDGWTKLTFTLSVKILRSKYVRSRAMALVDGDTIKNHPKLFAQVKSSFESVFGSNSFISLRLDSIESVLLQDPSAIAKFLDVEVKEIYEFIRKNKRKKQSDKRLLKIMIKTLSNDLLKYKPYTAEEIAQNFDENKIPIAFRKLIEKIVVTLI